MTRHREIAFIRDSKIVKSSLVVVTHNLGDDFFCSLSSSLGFSINNDEKTRITSLYEEYSQDLFEKISSVPLEAFKARVKRALRGIRMIIEATSLNKNVWGAKEDTYIRNIISGEYVNYDGLTDAKIEFCEKCSEHISCRFIIGPEFREKNLLIDEIENSVNDVTGIESRRSINEFIFNAYKHLESLSDIQGTRKRPKDFDVDRLIAGILERFRGDDRFSPYSINFSKLFVFIVSEAYEDIWHLDWPLNKSLIDVSIANSRKSMDNEAAGRKFDGDHLERVKSKLHERLKQIPPCD